MCKSKLHRLTVTETNLKYQGSLTLDEDLMRAGHLLPFEMINVVNVNNGARFETYVIKGERGSGIVCLNGAAARLAEPGDIIIVISSSLYSEDELKTYKPCVVFVDEHNRPKEISDH